MSNQKPPTPADLLQMQRVEVNRLSNEQATAIATSFVVARIRTDSLKSNLEIVNAFVELQEKLQGKLEQVQMGVAVKAIEALIPQQ